jgi:hypothetical protein
VWSKRKAYFILARIVSKDKREGVEQEKVVFYSSKNTVVRAKDTREGVEQEKVVFYSSKNSKSQGYKRRRGARERLFSPYLE